MTAAKSTSGPSKAAAGDNAPVSNFRLYNAGLVRDLKIRAAELDRYQQECWEEAINDWLRKSKYRDADSRDTTSSQVMVGIRVDEQLIHKFKVQARKLERTHGDCLEEAAEDWLKKHRGKR